MHLGVIRRHSVESDLECTRLPNKTIEHVDGAARVLCGGEKDGAVAPAAVVGREGDVCAEDGACAAEEILEILPADAVGEVSDEELGAGVTRW